MTTLDYREIRRFNLGVHRAREEYDRKPISNVVPLKPKRPPLTEQQQAEAIRLYGTGMTIEHVADELGSTYQLVREVLHSAGVVRKAGQQAKGVGR